MKNLVGTAFARLLPLYMKVFFIILFAFLSVGFTFGIRQAIGLDSLTPATFATKTFAWTLLTCAFGLLWILIFSEKREK